MADTSGPGESEWSIAEFWFAGPLSLVDAVWEDVNVLLSAVLSDARSKK